MTDSAGLPEFENPPVIEVVCGLLFKSIDSLLAPHLGVLWEKFKDEYPACQETAPLAPVIERFDETPPVQMELTDRPPLPRVWFVHRNENGIVQIQRDRFLHNWKKVRPDDAYPRYATVIKMFGERLTTFESFLEETKLGSIEPLQYEMTYVNHIPKGDGLETFNRVGDVFPDFGWRPDESRFLQTRESFTCRTSFTMPDETGRLHATIRSAVRRDDNLPIILFELTARGMPNDRSKEAMWAWFDLAHEWIVRGFADLTGENMHKNIWKRTR